MRWEWFHTGDVGAKEVLQPAGVVEVEVAHDNGFDVSDIVAGRFDCVGELHLLGVDCSWEQIGEWRTPLLYRVDQFLVVCLSSTEGRNTYNIDILGTARLEQDQAHVWMLDQDSHDDQVAGFVLWILVACTAAIRTA